MSEHCYTIMFYTTLVKHNFMSYIWSISTINLLLFLYNHNIAHTTYIFMSHRYYRHQLNVFDMVHLKICLVQVRLRAEVPRTPSSAWWGLELMTYRS